MAPMTILCVACILMYTRAAKCKEDQHCSKCDSTTGYCNSECEPGYFDQKCSSICNENCRNKKCKLSINGNDNCTEGCVPGYQGPGCGRPCYNPGGGCTACPGGCDGGYCQVGSSCVSGCVDSYYGSGCKTCHRGCKTCNRITGTCTQCHPSFPGPNCEQETNTTRGCEGGCVPGHVDRDCKHCSDKCLNKTCLPKKEPFDKRCNPGFYGEHCNKACGVCIDGDCDQMTGMCFRGCNMTTLGCEPSCRANCTSAECDIDTCPHDEEKSDERDLHQSINMGLLTVLCLFVFCILITVCVCYCRIMASQRESPGEEAVEYRDEPTRERLASMFIRSQHTYCDVDESDMRPVIVFL
ncbi:multiple epidermal growth factor-like domains protein 10 isoform X2 [Haliotis rufescens]|nr:multiple epidermal growth factor-like domains protein 10 isoform X2 [Haliotis rufescens]